MANLLRLVLVEYDPEAPEPYVAWLGSRVVGCGASRNEALAEARQSLRRNSPVCQLQAKQSNGQ